MIDASIAMGVHLLQTRTPGAERQRMSRLSLVTAAVLAAVTAPAPLSGISAVTPGQASAATMTFGSPLSVPATEDTANDLGYQGTNVQVPGSVFHIPHDGADTALWNTQLAAGSPTAPTSGQVVSVSLEGCAESNGPTPLTQIHFQALGPQPGGGAKVELTSQSFEIPICGQHGDSGTTVSTYQPINLCVSQGDYVAFNDEGGFVGAQNGPPPYPAGVPYMVIGSVNGSTLDSFIANNGVGNGAVFSPSEVGPSDGFATGQGQELMLQATLATGPDATPICPGGTKGVRTVKHHVFPTLTIPTPQLDGMNAHGAVAVAIYCHSTTTCEGTITLDARSAHRARGAWLGTSTFAIPPHSTGKAEIHLGALARRMVRNSDNSGLGVEATLASTPTAGTDTFKAAIAVRGAWR
jgi:hypothetical protein